MQVKKKKMMHHLEVDTGSSCWLPEDGDVVWIATKIPDVSVYPGDSGVLIPQTIVSCWAGHAQVI